MFERRQRAVQALEFNQTRRTLKAGEALPVLPGLAAQLMACQAELARQASGDFIETGDDELALDDEDLV